MTTNEKAKAEYLKQWVRVNSLHVQLADGLNAHRAKFEADGFKYGHGGAGSLAHYAEVLQDMVDSLTQQGEYAPENVSR